MHSAGRQKAASSHQKHDRCSGGRASRQSTWWHGSKESTATCPRMRPRRSVRAPAPPSSCVLQLLQASLRRHRLQKGGCKQLLPQRLSFGNWIRHIEACVSMYAKHAILHPHAHVWPLARPVQQRRTRRAKPPPIAALALRCDIFQNFWLLQKAKREIWTHWPLTGPGLTGKQGHNCRCTNANFVTQHYVPRLAGVFFQRLMPALVCCLRRFPADSAQA